MSIETEDQSQFLSERDFAVRMDWAGRSVLVSFENETEAVATEGGHDEIQSRPFALAIDNDVADLQRGQVVTLYGDRFEHGQQSYTVRNTYPNYDSGGFTRIEFTE